MSTKITKPVQFMSALGLMIFELAILSPGCHAQLGAICQCTDNNGAGPDIKWIACKTPPNAKNHDPCTGMGEDDCMYVCQIDYCAKRWTENVQSCSLGYFVKGQRGQ